MKNDTNNSRRKFLGKSIKIGAITAISGIGLSKLANKLYASNDQNSEEEIELMDTDGNKKLVRDNGNL